MRYFLRILTSHKWQLLLFYAFVFGATQGAVSSEKGDTKLLFLSDLGYTTEAYINYFPLKPTGGSVDDEIEALVIVTVNFNEDIGENASLDMDVEFTKSTVEKAEHGHFSKVYNQNSGGKITDFNSIEYTLFAEDFDLIIGKTSVDVGSAELYSATDVFNQSKTVNPLHPKSIGKWQLGLEYFLGDNSLRGLILPVDAAAAAPPKGSRWNSDGNSNSGTSFPGLSLPTDGVISMSYRGQSISNWGFLLKFNGVKTGLDYYYGIYSGPGGFTVLRQPSITASEQNFAAFRPLALIALSGFVRTIDSWKFYGDFLMQRSFHDEDDELVRYSIGFRYKETSFANSVGLDEISPIVEFADEFIIRGFKNSNVYASSQASRPNPHNLITAVEFKVDDKKEFRFSLNYNIKDNDHSSGVGAQYKPNDNLNLYINVYGFGGASNTHFGQYRKNKNIEIGLKQSF